MKTSFLTVIFLSILQITTAYAYAEQAENAQPSSQRFKIGIKKLNEINGEGAGERIIESFKDVSPDLAKYAIEYGFGDLLSRNALPLKTKEMIIIAHLAAMANSPSQLKAHINAALNVGVTKEEIAEIMLLTSAYSGFPAAINGTLALKEVLEKRSK